MSKLPQLIRGSDLREQSLFAASAMAAALVTQRPGWSALVQVDDAEGWWEAAIDYGRPASPAHIICKPEGVEVHLYGTDVPELKHTFAEFTEQTLTELIQILEEDLRQFMSSVEDMGTKSLSELLTGLASVGRHADIAAGIFTERLLDAGPTWYVDVGIDESEGVAVVTVDRDLGGQGRILFRQNGIALYIRGELRQTWAYDDSYALPRIIEILKSPES